MGINSPLQRRGFQMKKQYFFNISDISFQPLQRLSELDAGSEHVYHKYFKKKKILESHQLTQGNA